MPNNLDLTSLPKFKYGTTSRVNSEPIVNHSILVDIETGDMFVDLAGSRMKIGSTGRVIEILSTLPETWTTSDNGRVFIWESASIDGSLSKGHIYKVHTTETPSGISLQLTPSATTASTAEKVKGLYTPYDTVDGSSNGTVRAYTRYKNPNNYWLVPYISESEFTNIWMITDDPTIVNPAPAVDYISAISAEKTSLTAADLTSTQWGSGFMGMSNPVFTDVAGSVSADFEDLTPESSVDIPIASPSTLGGVKIGDNIEIAEDGTISAVVPQLEEDVTSWEVNTVPGAVEFFALRSTVAKADNDIVIDWGDGTSTVLKTAEVLEYTDNSVSTDGNHYVDNPDHKVTCYTGEWESDGELAFGFEHVYQTTNTAAKIVIKGNNYFGISRAINYNNWRGSLNAFLATNRHPLMSRCLAEDLPVAKCVNNLAWFAAFTDKLSKVQIPTGWDLDRIENWYGCFMYSSIQEAKGFNYKLSYARNCAELFSHCSQLTSCDFKFPCILKYPSTCNATFWGCTNLEGDIASFFPKAGLAVSRKAEFINTFSSCAKLTGTVPAKQLWENDNVEWTNTCNAFANCSDAIRAQVPVEWGGTMVRAYKDTYKGQLKREQTTVTVTGQNQQLTLDAGQTACLVITGAGTCSLSLSNWEDGDSCEVVVNTSQVTLQIDESWVTNKLDIITTPRLYVLELAQYEGSVFCKVKYPDTGEGPSTSYTLPIASAATLGGVKIGDNLSITEDGILSAGTGDTSAFETRLSTVESELGLIQNNVSTLENLVGV